MVERGSLETSRWLDKTDLNKACGQEVAVGQVMSGGNDENFDMYMLLFLKEKNIVFIFATLHTGIIVYQCP